jgi:DNA repair exonuclease SbcCD nuclease subunit
MGTRFIHTADWQIGKPFAGMEDAHKRALVQQERLSVIQRIGEAAERERAEFILVAGDLFDTPTVTRATVSATCGAIGRLGLPVLAIPGNHDHGGPGSIWEQAFFQREQASLAPNFRILLEAAPVELESAVIFPCPLLRRAESVDPAAWLGSVDALAFGPKPRIVLAHGSTQGFGSQADDEEAEGLATNLIDLARLAGASFDYLALGDWHGTKQVGPKAWYAGTPELDRFPKGEANDPGHVLAVAAARGGLPEVTAIRTARFHWHGHAFDLSEDAALGRLEQDLEGLLGQRVQEDFLRLELTGSLGIEATTRLEQFIEALEARLLRLKLSNQALIAPTPAETDALAHRLCDPLISRVAEQLVTRAAGAGEDAAIARAALRALHAACEAGSPCA